MAKSENGKEDQAKTFENNNAVSDEQNLITDSPNYITQDKNKNENVAGNEPQQVDVKELKQKLEQDNVDKKTDVAVNNSNKVNDDDDAPTIVMSEETRKLENLKNASTKSFGDFKIMEDRKDDKRTSRRMSNYLQNIQMTNSSLGLTLNGEKKDTSLLTDSKTVVRYSPLWKQTLAASVPILLTFVNGLTSGYSAILLPQLKTDNGPIPSDEDTASWIAAMAALPMAPGCLVSGWMMEKFGRRTSHYITCVPMIVGWILIASCNNLGLMLIGRFFTGLCAGLFGPLIPVYIGETTEPRYRGFFLAGVSLAIALGILVAHIIGTFVHWQYTAMICCAFPIAAVGLLTLIPESPTWLISQGRIDEGVKAFYWLRGFGDDAKKELKAIIDNKKAADNAPRMTRREKLASLKSPELLKPLAIMIMFFVTCQFSGVNAVAFYSIEIVEKAVGKGIDHYLAMLIIDSLRVVMSVIACIICKQYGRRPLCFISGIWTSISMIGLSMFLYWKPENMSWLPLLCLMCYICAISIGLVPLPWIMCGEVFPTKVRGLGSGISSATTFVAFFTVVKTAPGMMSNFGEVITFLFYGVVAFVGTVIMYFILPETKGKSLQEIEDRFKFGKRPAGPKV
ncbi:facilitated trehalose transporter Tret1-2 homolog [Trichoplusia ni]|uniref:Facilitated trehalose transporter Tret1-2 homolog n=1 Tax=Trichoplusia ni TaxID=7111 RepID=A0A7E5VQI7_TRINI|nr:facilitated trehalose transporter Tret1-2 homolog [Trichoplusia ni]